jgi:truncated hemoglobin YjbI
MPIRKSALSLFLLVLACIVPVYAQSQQAAATQPSLYKRLGGYDALAVTDDFIGRLASDPHLSRFFVTHNQEGLKRIRQHVVDFLCVAAGGPCVYTVRI